MGNNKSAKKQLIERYGKIDFLDRLHIKVPQLKKYKSKGQLRKMKQLTYHHIVPQKQGGKTNIENGALMSLEHHEWFHLQSEEVQQQLNELFQELKRRIDNSQEVPVIFTDEDIDLPFKVNVMLISIDERGKITVHTEEKENDVEER